MSVTMKYVPYDALGGAAVPTLASGEYTVDPQGNYHFSSADVGKAVLITDTFFYNNRLTQELHVVPTSSPHTFQADEGGETNDPKGHVVPIFLADFGVRYYTSGTPLTKVSGTPTAGQYTISISGGFGTYGFSSADAGAEVVVSYEYYNYSDDLYAPSTLNVTFFPGLLGQAGWSYLATKHPDQAVAYSQAAYAAFQDAYLGMSATPPAHSYEVIGMNTLGGSTLDASPVDCLQTLLIDPDVGIGFPDAQIDQASWYTNANSAQNWVLAQGFLLSQALTNQEPVATVASRWLEAFQIAFFFSEGRLKLAPFGDQAVSGTLGSYTPDTTVVARFTDSDYLVDQADDPVTVTRSPWTDAYNRVQVQYTNRFNAYNSDLVYEQDEASVERFGLRLEPPVSYDFLTSETVAAAVANLRVKRNVQIRNQYVFRVPIRYEYVEPMDLVQISDSRLGLNSVTVRVTKVENDIKQGLTITAEDYPGNGYAMPVVNPKAATPPGHPTYWTQPALQTTGLIVQGFGASGNQPTIDLAIYATGNSPSWGGCLVWASFDATNFNVVATITQPSRIYELTSALPAIVANPSGANQTTPDTVNTLALAGITSVNATATGLPAWSGGATYSKGSTVTYDARVWVWVSPTSGNSTPTSANPNWQQITDTPPAGSALQTVTPSAATNLVTLSALLDVSSQELTTAGIELLSYELVGAGSAPNTYDLTTLYRGAFNTYGSWTDGTKKTPLETQSFPAGSLFVRYADASAKYSVPATYAGQTIYFRFTALNTAGGSAQDVSQAQTYAFVLQASGALGALEFGPFPTLDQIDDGVTRGAVNKAYLTPNNVVNNFKGPWDATTPYYIGDEVSWNGNYWKAILNSVDSIPATNNGNWHLVGPITTDNIANGEFTYVDPQGVIRVADLPYNGYFDIWPNQSGPPEGWEGASFGDGNTSVSPAFNDAPSVNGGGVYVADLSGGPIVSRPFGVAVGETLQIFAWARCGASNAVRIVIYYFSSNQNIERGSGDLLASETFTANVGGGWQQLTFQTQGPAGLGAPSGVAIARIALYNDGGHDCRWSSVAVLPNLKDTLNFQESAITVIQQNFWGPTFGLTANTFQTAFHPPIETGPDAAQNVVMEFGAVFVNQDSVTADMTIQIYRGTTGGTLVWQQSGPFVPPNGSVNFVMQAVDDAPPPNTNQQYTLVIESGFSGYIREKMFFNLMVAKR